jgi:hypothetical protein
VQDELQTLGMVVAWQDNRGTPGTASGKRLGRSSRLWRPGAELKRRAGGTTSDVVALKDAAFADCLSVPQKACTL